MNTYKTNEIPVYDKNNEEAYIEQLMKYCKDHHKIPSSNPNCDPSIFVYAPKNVLLRFSVGGGDVEKYDGMEVEPSGSEEPNTEEKVEEKVREEVSRKMEEEPMEQEEEEPVEEKLTVQQWSEKFEKKFLEEMKSKRPEPVRLPAVTSLSRQRAGYLARRCREKGINAFIVRKRTSGTEQEKKSLVLTYYHVYPDKDYNRTHSHLFEYMREEGEPKRRIYRCLDDPECVEKPFPECVEHFLENCSRWSYEHRKGEGLFIEVYQRMTKPLDYKTAQPLIHVIQNDDEVKGEAYGIPRVNEEYETLEKAVEEVNELCKENVLNTVWDSPLV